MRLASRFTGSTGCSYKETGEVTFAANRLDIPEIKSAYDNSQILPQAYGKHCDLLIKGLALTRGSRMKVARERGRLRHAPHSTPVFGPLSTRNFSILLSIDKTGRADN
jgi:hypothetical protein